MNEEFAAHTFQLQSDFDTLDGRIRSAILLRQTFHFAAAALLVSAFSLAAAHAQAPVPDSPAIEQKVDAMVSKLSLQQKLELIGGVDSMFIRAEPAADFPMLKMSDGPVGVRTWGPDTAYTAGIALAASWDPELARQVGVALGDDARARGVNFLLGPGVDIYRAPMNGRNFEYFGEDPYLAAHTAVPYIEGVQSQGVIATIKHFAANNEEYDRHNVSSDVDERTLREIYLPAFEAAVKVAHVGAVMDSYNLVNNVHMTQNKHLNIDVLKKDWGFKGIVMSDWDATYSAVGAANGGLDLEMPSGQFMNPKNLTPAVMSGKVSQATIDDKVRRIFRTAIRFGFLDRDQTDLSIPRDSQTARKVALDEALESLTLLKNENNLLPLDASSIHTIAVIGPDAWPAVPGGGGSSEVTPYSAVSFMNGISNYLGTRAKVSYVRGLPTTAELFQGTKFGTLAEVAAQTSQWSGPEPVKVEVFDNADFSGTPTIAHTRSISTFKSQEWTPAAKTRKTIRYTTVFTPEKTGKYLFLVGAGGSDAYKLMVDGKQVVEEAPHEGQAPKFVELQLTANTPANIQLDYMPDSSYPRIGFGVRAVDGLVSADAKKIAAMADVVVVPVGFDPTTESEGMDRTFNLPWGQNELIEAMAQANKKTIVTITAGGNVYMVPWIDRVPAVFHNWYPGEQGGKAFAEILFGDRSPEGHLPASFARTWSENPVYDNYYAPPVPKGQTPQVKYAEGVFLGYRYYTTFDKKPMFPFGYGLSYTTFKFSNLQVSPTTATSDGIITVNFDVANTGQRAGADVAQLYVGDPSAKIKRPVKELKGYDKVRLAPGATQHVSLKLNRRALAYWDTQKNDWRVDPGKFTIFVGDSSEETPLTADFTVQ